MHVRKCHVQEEGTVVAVVVRLLDASSNEVTGVLRILVAQSLQVYRLLNDCFVLVKREPHGSVGIVVARVIVQ